MTVIPVIKKLITEALLEDLGQGDVTTDNLAVLNTPENQSTGSLSVREACVISGLDIACQVFWAVDPALKLDLSVSDGDSLQAGDKVLTVQGQTASLLKAERVALNFLQHLSGIATETRRYADAIAGTSAKVTDTRKTTPGLRFLEKQAVLHGGGSPHRFNLGSSAMLKDNHIKAVGSIKKAVDELRQHLSHTATIEVEVDTLEQVKEAVESGADIILLDNMDPATLCQAVATINGKAIAEASGGITLSQIRAIAETGVSFISTSKITLGAPMIDIGLDFS